MKCAIPAFDGLLPEPHNTRIMRLLFSCSHWHGMAKLRMHTDATLAIFDELTVTLGAEFRFFASQTCSAFETCELQREKDARERRKEQKSKKKSQSNDTTTSGTEKSNTETNDIGSSRADHTTSRVSSTSTMQDADTRPKPAQEGERRTKAFNLRRYKYHALGDYPEMIRRYGTTDSYSTEPVSPKRFALDFHRAELSSRGNWNIVLPSLATLAPIKNSSSSN